MRKAKFLAPSILAAACFPIVASAQTIVFSENFDSGTGGTRFTAQNAGAGDFNIDYNYNYGDFQYLRFPQGGANPPTIQPIPPAPGGSTTTGVRISVNDTAGAIANVQILPTGVNVSGNYKMTFDMWMNYNGGALGGTGSTETFIAGLNIDGGTGVIGPIGTANGYAFSATGEGGATQDYRMVDRGDPIDDGPGYPKVNGIWPANDEWRWDRDTGNLSLSNNLRVNDRPHNHFNSFYDSVFPGDTIGGGTFETRGAPGKAWVGVTIEQSDNEVLYYLNGRIISTLFRATAAAGVPSLGYADEFASLANPAIDNFILFDNIVITQNAATPRFTATSGNFSNPANWSGGAVPGGAGVKAEFGGAAGPATVTVDTPVTLRSMAFNSADSYTVAGPSTITLTGDQNSFINNGGSHTVSAPVVTQGNVAVYAAPDTTLTVQNLTTDPTKAFGKAGLGTFTTNQVRATALHVSGGVLKVLPGGVNRATSVQLLNATGRMDLTTAPLIIDYTLRTAASDPAINSNPFPEILAEVLSAWNNGDWLGQSGFTSSNAIAEPNRYAVGYIDNSIVGLTTYLGEQVDSDTVIVRGTRRGDANLDGIVNLADFNRLAANFGASNAHWWQGDFNYDGLVNLSDFNALAANFGLQAGPDGPTPDDWAALGSAVPEPSSLALIGAGALALVRRQRRA